jgi:hypothetical protein
MSFRCQYYLKLSAPTNAPVVRQAGSGGKEAWFKVSKQKLA